MGAQPGANGLHGQRLRRDRTQGDQVAPDGHVGVSVAPGVSQAHDLSVRHDDPPGPLYVQEKGVHRTVHPEELQAAPGQGAALDLGPGLKGNQPAVDHAPGNALSLPLRAEPSQVGGDEVGGAGIDGHAVGPAGAPCAPQLRLIVPGEQAFGVAVVGGQIRNEPGLEETAGRRVVAPGDPGQGGADGAPVADGAPGTPGSEGPFGGQVPEAGTGTGERRKGGAVGVLAPAGKPVERRAGEGQLGRRRRWRLRRRTRGKTRHQRRRKQPQGRPDSQYPGTTCPGVEAGLSQDCGWRPASSWDHGTRYPGQRSRNR